jgi:hypothetical protein
MSQKSEPQRPPRVAAPPPHFKLPNAGLDHGTESLVALDNPDDSQLGAPTQAKGTPSDG